MGRPKLTATANDDDHHQGMSPLSEERDRRSWEIMISVQEQKTSMVER